MSRVLGIKIEEGSQIFDVLAKIEVDFPSYKWVNGKMPTKFIPKGATMIELYSGNIISFLDGRVDKYDILSSEFLSEFKEDKVNHPIHYLQHKFESIDEMIIVFGAEVVMHFCICNAWKYRNRAPYKGKFDEDNEKADWYLSKAKELQEVYRL